MRYRWGYEMTKRKLLFVDLIRIVATLLVVFWHVISNMPKDFGYLKFYFWIYNLILINMGSIAVTNVLFY